MQLLGLEDRRHDSRVAGPAAAASRPQTAIVKSWSPRRVARDLRQLQREWALAVVGGELRLAHHGRREPVLLVEERDLGEVRREQLAEFLSVYSRVWNSLSTR